jgi:hypothetical protein
MKLLILPLMASVAPCWAFGWGSTETIYLCESKTMKAYFVQGHSFSDGKDVYPVMVFADGKEWEAEKISSSTSKKFVTPEVGYYDQSPNRFTFRLSETIKLGVILRDHTLDTMRAETPMELYLDRGDGKEQKEIAHCERVGMGGDRWAAVRKQMDEITKRLRKARPMKAK